MWLCRILLITSYVQLQKQAQVAQVYFPHFLSHIFTSPPTPAWSSTLPPHCLSACGLLMKLNEKINEKSQILYRRLE